MNEQDVNVTNMVWQPEMIALTQAPDPDIDNGETTQIFVNPQMIVAIYRLVVERWNKDKTATPEFRVGTFVVLQVGGHVTVTESPGRVALLRDRALGHERKMAMV